MAGSMGFFEKFNSQIMGEIDKLSEASTSVYAQGITTVATGAITLYIIWMGYQTWAGKTQAPMQDTLWNLAKFGIILSFINNIDGYLDSAMAAVEGLKTGFTGDSGSSVWAQLDTLWQKTQELGEAVYKMDDDFVPMTGWGARNMVWIGSIVLMAITAFVFFVADITIKLLSLTAPIFIFCLMFGFLRQMFNNWLMLIFSSVLTVLFATLVINIGMAYMDTILDQVKQEASYANLMTVGVMALLAGLLAGLMVLLAKSFASQLAGVGVDGAVQGMAIMGLGAAAWGLSKGLGAGDPPKKENDDKDKNKKDDNNKDNATPKSPGQLTPGEEAMRKRSQNAVQNMKMRNQQ